MICGGIIRDGMSKSMVDPYRVCILRVKATSVLSEQCGKWIHGRYARAKRVTLKFSCRKCEGNIGEVVE